MDLRIGVVGQTLISSKTKHHHHEVCHCLAVDSDR